MNPEAYWQKIIILLISILCQAVGLACYLDTNIIMIPPDGLMLALKTKLTKLSVGTIKIIEDLTFVAVTVIISLIVMGKVIGVREGTVVVALLVGKVMDPIYKRIHGPLIKLFGMEKENENDEDRQNDD